MAGNIRLNAPSGGSVTINAVDTASNFTMSVPAAAGVLINADSATGAAQIPVGTTAQRPASPTTGQLRYNTTTASTEVYNGTAWTSVSPFLVEYVVIAGGGGGGYNVGGGGGAGGYINQSFVALTKGTAYTVTIGAGGAQTVSGSNTVFGSVTATGGGGGGGNAAGSNGGSGGGGGAGSGTTSGGTGTTDQGTNGATGVYPNYGGGGGGGGGAATVQTGGAPATSLITGSAVSRAGGGGGGAWNLPAGSASGGGGAGGGNSGNGTAGTANTGGGGGGGGSGGASGAAGGSGIVIIRYPSATQTASGGTVTSYTYNGVVFQCHTFTTSGTFTA